MIRRGCSSKDVFYSCNHFSWAVRFADIVICSQFQPQQPVNFLNTGGDHDKRNAGKGPNLLADLKTIFAGQHEVKKNQIIPPRSYSGDDVIPVTKPFCFKTAGDTILLGNVKLADGFLNARIAISV